MSVYLSKDRKCVTATRIESLEHKLYMHNFLLSLDLFDYLLMEAINCCGTLRPNLTGIPRDLGRKQTEMG
jgi:hypothetical protein